MKTQLHRSKLQARELLAWVVLTIAIVLFATSLTFAQDSGSKTSGKIHIRFEKDEDGKKTSIDTTFDAKELEAAQDFMNSLDESPKTPRPPGTPGHTYSYRFRSLPFDEEDSGQFQDEMKKLQEEMKGLEKQLREMHIEMYTDSGWTVPPIPPIPPSGDAKEWKHWGETFDHHWNSSCFRIFSDSTKEGPRVMILDGDEEEVIEKALKDKHSKVIIIQRDARKSDKEKSATARSSKDPKTEKSRSGDKLDARLETYPNPGNGRFTLGFQLDKKGDATIEVFDPAGKMVFTEKLEDFSGAYSNTLDISSRGKGTYLLKVTQNGKSITKKIVVE